MPTISGFPLTPRPDERDRIERGKAVVADNLQQVKDAWKDIRRTLVDATRTHQWMKLNSEKIFTRPLETDFALEAVLLIGVRFGRPPEEVLAHWIAEGLAGETVWKYELGEPRHECLGGEDTLDQVFGQQPGGHDEARAWLRSAVLYYRWGLDKLAAHRRVPGSDNVLIAATKKQHDIAFTRGYHSERIGRYLEKSPLGYLSSRSSPLRVFDTPAGWKFRVDKEYQSLMLAMQQARFVFKRSQIPDIYRSTGLSVLVRPAFAALGYIYTNSKNPDAVLGKMVGVLNKWRKSENISSTRLTSAHLYRAYISSPIPDDIKDYVRAKGPISHSYVNGLRYELARQVYEVAFRGVDIREVDAFQL